MHSDIVKLRDFYRSKLGRITQRAIYDSLKELWPRLPQERLLGLGYCRPYLNGLSKDSELAMAFMPAAQGAVAWPDGAHSATALVFEEDLPLADSSLDRIVVVHGFEHAESPANFLAEMWRVLAPNGELVMVVPNRRGVWARFDHTPFGAGRPYTKAQLSAPLAEAGFSITGWSEAMFHSPFRSWLRFGWLKFAFASTNERLGKRLWPAFSGVILVRANKKLYQGLPVSERVSRRVFVPVLQPQGVRARDSVGRQSPENS